VRWTEGMVHVAVRCQLRDDGWMLVAGQYPGGSDDELPPLNIVDPALARDLSPDPRAHSRGKLVPDVVALRQQTLLLVEAKVGYSDLDRRKLETMLGERRDDLDRALRRLGERSGIPQLFAPAALVIVPVLAQAAERPAPPPPPGFGQIRAVDLEHAGVFLPPRLSACR
jgi:hypothetical protein